jgi:hypothetical protein
MKKFLLSLLLRESTAQLEKSSSNYEEIFGLDIVDHLEYSVGELILNEGLITGKFIQPHGKPVEVYRGSLLNIHENLIYDDNPNFLFNFVNCEQNIS